LFNLSGKSENKVYIRSTVSDKVFEIQNSKLVSFLNSDVNFWADSSIIPQSVFANNNIQSIRIIKNGKKTVYDDKSTIKKLISLTHGKIQNSMQLSSDELEDDFQSADNINSLQNSQYFSQHFSEQFQERFRFIEQTTIFADFGDGSEIKIHAKPLTDESYVLTYAFLPANQIEKPVREIIQRFNYSVIVSSWTMNNFTGE
ncbi:MAG: hypothetical protein K5640_07235, partial [Treponema sp.]|nr:hypothetical protein [Treponema sp.]